MSTRIRQPSTTVLHVLLIAGIIVGVVVIGSQAGMAAGGDDRFEPNDDVEDAATIQSGVFYDNLQVVDDDTDRFNLQNVEEGTTVEVSIFYDRGSVSDELIPIVYYPDSDCSMGSEGSDRSNSNVKFVTVTTGCDDSGVLPSQTVQVLVKTEAQDPIDYGLKVSTSGGDGGGGSGGGSDGGGSGGGSDGSSRFSLENTEAEANTGEEVTVDFPLTNQGEDSGFILNPHVDELGNDWEITATDDGGGLWKSSETKWLFQTISSSESKYPSVTLQVPEDASEGEHEFTVTATSSSDDTETATAVIDVTKILSIAEALDENGNGLIDDSEILEATEYWGDVDRFGNREPVPQTGGKTIDDSKILELMTMWRTEGRI